MLKLYEIEIKKDRMKISSRLAKLIFNFYIYI